MVGSPGPYRNDLSEQIKNSVANSAEANIIKSQTPHAFVQNRYLEEIRQKEVAKQKLIKMSAYQKSIHELYMPKQSDKKRQEREALQASLKTEVREKRPFENYLGFVKQMNKKTTERTGSRGVMPGETEDKRLTGVASLPNLNPRNLQSE